MMRRLLLVAYVFITVAALIVLVMVIWAPAFPPVTRMTVEAGGARVPPVRVTTTGPRLITSIEAAYMVLPWVRPGPRSCPSSTSIYYVRRYAVTIYMWLGIRFTASGGLCGIWRSSWGHARLDILTSPFDVRVKLCRRLPPGSH